VLGQTRRADEILVVGRDEAGVSRRVRGVSFIDTGIPVCAAAARNRGLEASTGDIVVFTDSDCIPAADWLETHARLHASGADVVGGAVLLNGSNYWAQSDNLSLFHEFMVGHEPSTRLFLPTLNLSVRRAVIEQVGLFDESFPGAAAEDTDWTIRMRLAGYSLRFEPAAVVAHRPMRTTLVDVVRHWWKLGYSGIRVRHRYAEQFKTPGLARNALMLRMLSPLIALQATARIYANRMYWSCLWFLPVVYATKVIYCLGAAASVQSRYAFIGPAPPRRLSRRRPD